MFVTKTAKTVTNISKLSPTYFVSNIRHQHRCSLIGFFETKQGFYCYVKDQSAKHSNCLIDGKGRTRKDGGPKYQAELKSKLYSFFKSYNDELFEWIGEDFGWNTNI